ncbi:MAG TPA: single-stranded DNA-binding protein [Persephonella sp.]|uniref:Single-stranded DNA-binding protein n=1 Tax=Persephonella marina (strain DSM 14350 / EX-H1) TaxID=123214 RepID=C0QQW8_PERMH|nr:MULTISPECIES: single-stranded DNA-binding protein [Persephonella]ACO03604.1 single-strand binding protein family protein [Persephonella marina EX-H1]HCB68814.1 single-stranded DNA-binding protein [Persephonella sp.]
MLNKVFLIGRLTRDPEIRFLPSGSQVTSFSVAVNRSYRVNNEWKEETYFFDVEAFGYLAERLGKQLNKGTQILIEGQLRQDRWETAGGDKRTKVKIVADKVSILSPKGEKAEKSEEEPELDIENSIEDFSSDEDVPF